jgi:hypothetical protein
MSETEREGRSSRRDFLRLASVGATAAGVAAVSAGAAEAAEAPAGESGYRKTEHVAKYLDSCRF